jgi:hypothetical protein
LASFSVTLNGSVASSAALEPPRDDAAGMVDGLIIADEMLEILIFFLLGFRSSEQ